MQCRACSASINKASKWKIFDQDYQGDIPDCEENLCGTCLQKARLAYNNLMNMDAASIEAECKVLFYKGFMGEEDPSTYLQIDPDYNTLQIEET